MSTPTTKPPVAVPPVNDHALSKTASGMDMAAKLKSVKDRLEAAREAARKAEEELQATSKPRRDQARGDDRRALLVGRVMLAQFVVDRAGWEAMWPDLVASLATANVKDRALFGLLPMPEPVKEGVEKAPVPTASITPGEDAEDEENEAAEAAEVAEAAVAA